MRLKPAGHAQASAKEVKASKDPQHEKLVQGYFRWRNAIYYPITLKSDQERRLQAITENIFPAQVQEAQALFFDKRTRDEAIIDVYVSSCIQKANVPVWINDLDIPRITIGAYYLGLVINRGTIFGYYNTPGVFIGPTTNHGGEYLKKVILCLEGKDQHMIRQGNDSTGVLIRGKMPSMRLEERYTPNQLPKSFTAFIDELREYSKRSEQEIIAKYGPTPADTIKERVDLLLLKRKNF
jgi:hypothetical protein